MNDYVGYVCSVNLANSAELHNPPMEHAIENQLRPQSEAGLRLTKKACVRVIGGEDTRPLYRLFEQYDVTGVTTTLLNNRYASAYNSAVLKNVNAIFFETEI